jgi:hypothetical protein
LSVELSDEAEGLLSRGESILPALLRSLSDPERFVTAHALLTRITGVPHETFPTWNGLNVTLETTGEVAIESTQREQLAKRWRDYFRDHPRPVKHDG